MKMDDMVRWLEREGFAVDKRYSNECEQYRFRIERNGHSLVKFFKYPEDWRNRDRIQRCFLELLVTEFEAGDRKNKMIEKEKKEMVSNLDIKWAVTSLGMHVEQDGEVELTGEIKGYIPGQSSLKRFTLDNEKTALELMTRMNGYKTMSSAPLPEIKDVLFNSPATIVWWMDGTKTVVTAQDDDEYDPEKGLAMAMCKKVLGNQGNYFNLFKKWEKKAKQDRFNQVVRSREKERKNYNKKLKKAIAEQASEKKEELTWKIWVQELNDQGERVGAHVYIREYKTRASAVRRAKQLYNNPAIGNFKWEVSQTNPWDILITDFQEDIL